MKALFHPSRCTCKIFLVKDGETVWDFDPSSMKERQINRMSETMSRVMVSKKAGIYIAGWSDCNANTYRWAYISLITASEEPATIELAQLTKNHAVQKLVSPLAGVG